MDRYRSQWSDDPLTRALMPPRDETPEDRQRRIAAEIEAKRVNDEIDARLEMERQAQKKGKRPLKILLLGQSESGKSTTLKNFQLQYTPHAFRAERAAWRGVIWLNLLRSIHKILDVLGELIAERYPALTNEHRRLQMRLSPLRHAEGTLKRRLSPVGSTGEEGDEAGLDWTESQIRASQEFAVRNNTQWKGALTRWANHRNNGRPRTANSETDRDDPANVIEACKDDMQLLWKDPTLREELRRRRIRLEEAPGFFLDDIERIASTEYSPKADDVLRARLRTVGVQEHRLKIESGSEAGQEWRIYDVGGARSQRASWVPFFDSVSAIIFLAPLSAFDQPLQENRRVNRMEDSLLLWKAICANRLLSNVEIILFLNKIDILKAKLEAGIQLKTYVPSFKDHPNDFETVSRYFRAKFKAIQREYSPEPRSFYCHLTSVTDPTATSAIMANVREVVVKANLMTVHVL